MDEKDLHTGEPLCHTETNKKLQDFINNQFSFRNVLIATAVLGILLLIYLIK